MEIYCTLGSNMVWVQEDIYEELHLLKKQNGRIDRSAVPQNILSNVAHCTVSPFPLVLYSSISWLARGAHAETRFHPTEHCSITGSRT